MNIKGNSEIKIFRQRFDASAAKRSSTHQAPAREVGNEFLTANNRVL